MIKKISYFQAIKKTTLTFISNVELIFDVENIFFFSRYLDHLVEKLNKKKLNHILKLLYY
jgi:hypothetical protein